MEIEHAAAVKLLQDIGLTHADKYNQRDLLIRIRRLPNIVDEYTIISSVESDQLFEQLLVALAAQEPIMLVGQIARKAKPNVAGESTEAPVAVGTESADGPKTTPKDKKKTPPVKEAPKTKTTPKEIKPKAGPKKEKGVGVIASIVELLKTASKKKPMALEELVNQLAKRFPEREKSAMTNTVKIQVKGRIEKERQIKVNSSDKGYWI